MVECKKKCEKSLENVFRCFATLSNKKLCNEELRAIKRAWGPVAQTDLTLFTFFLRCPKTEYLNYKVSDTVYQRFSFSAFKIEGSEVVYLHCEVLICAENSGNKTRCAEGCTKDLGNSRRRRDASNQDQRKGVTSLGPLKILTDRLEVQPPGEGMR